MSIAIIGGAGFIGTRLAHRLNDSEFDYTIYDKDTSSSDKIVELDVENSQSLSKIMNCEAIINLAAVHRDDVEPKSRYDDVNVQGSKNICDAARKYGINKIIFKYTLLQYMVCPLQIQMNLADLIISTTMAEQSSWPRKFIGIGTLRIQPIEH